MVVVILVELYLRFKMIGIKTFIFDPKNIEGHGRRNGKGLEYALGHTFETIKGEDNQVFIGRISSIEVRAATEGICFHGFSWFVVKFVIVLLEFNLPGGGTGSNFMGFTPVSKIAMVSPDDNRYRGSSK